MFAGELGGPVWPADKLKPHEYVFDRVKIDQSPPTIIPDRANLLNVISRNLMFAGELGGPVWPAQQRGVLRAQMRSDCTDRKSGKLLYVQEALTHLL